MALILALTVCTRGQEIRRPTANADTASSHNCIGVRQLNVAMPLFYDAGTPPTSTCSIQFARGSNTQSLWKGRLFSAWQTSGSRCSALVLNVNLLCDISNNGQCAVEYSVNSGSSWTTLDADITGLPQQTFTAVLSNSQSLPAIQVRICVEGDEGEGIDQGAATMSGYDIWTACTVSLPPTGAIGGIIP